MTKQMLTRDISSYENLQENIRDLKTPKIECWTNQYNDQSYQVSLECPELTCICPKTGLPDFGTLYLTYTPTDLCLELKSFKMYLHFFRNIGIFHEHLSNKILEDIVSATSPQSATVKVEMKPRGGILTKVSTSYQRPSKKDSV